LLQKHGYPYVLDRYRFHLTLSAPASEPEEQAMRQWLESRVAALPPTRIDALSICREATPGAAFELLERIPLVASGMGAHVVNEGRLYYVMGHRAQARTACLPGSVRMAFRTTCFAHTATSPDRRMPAAKIMWR
jgi:hypothetical protein